MRTPADAGSTEPDPTTIASVEPLPGPSETKGQEPAVSDEDVYSTAEEDEVASRLEALGYLG